MKRQLLLKAACAVVAALPLCVPAMAQEQPEECFPQGTVWEEEYHLLSMNGWDFYSYYLRSTVSGEMTIDGVTYKMVTPELKVTDNWDDDPENFPGWDGSETGWHWEALSPYGIREEAGKVFYYGNLHAGDAPSMEVLRFDFNDWEVGKEIPLIPTWNADQTFCYQDITIADIGTVKMVDGSESECAIVSSGASKIPAQVRYLGNIERVSMFENMMVMWTDKTYMCLRNFTRNGELIYENNVQSGSELGIKTASVNNNSTGGLYTLQGIMCNGRDATSLPKGIYIKDGRKYLVK